MQGQERYHSPHSSFYHWAQRYIWSEIMAYIAVLKPDIDQQEK
jgi:hypothetical protein